MRWLPWALIPKAIERRRSKARIVYAPADQPLSPVLYEYHSRRPSPACSLSISSEGLAKNRRDVGDKTPLSWTLLQAFFIYFIYFYTPIIFSISFLRLRNRGGGWTDGDLGNSWLSYVPNNERIRHRSRGGNIDFYQGIDLRKFQKGSLSGCAYRCQLYLVLFPQRGSLIP